MQTPASTPTRTGFTGSLLILVIAVPTVVARLSNKRKEAGRRTFWEKATALHAEAHRPSASAPPAYFSRHYYDLAMLLDPDEGKAASVAFPAGPVQDAAKMGALFSLGSAVIAIAAGRIFKVRRHV